MLPVYTHNAAQTLCVHVRKAAELHPEERLGSQNAGKQIIGRKAQGRERIVLIPCRVAPGIEQLEQHALGRNVPG